MPDETNIKNNLWRARKKQGLERKQVASLLAKKGGDEISRYEKNVYLPNLKTALKLEIIYKTPVRLLFEALFEECRREIGEERAKRKFSLPADWQFPASSADVLRREEFCFYADILKRGVPSPLELEAVNKHTVALINTVSDFSQGRAPFAGD